MTRSRAEIGRANRARGIATERELARYLRVNGWPDAERKPDTGWSTVDRSCPDVGDIRNTAGLCWQAKSSPELTGERLATAMRQTAEQTAAAGARYGIVVHRRTGKASPGQWWAYLPLGDLVTLATQRTRQAPDHPVWNTPVRTVLADVVSLLHYAGYGTREAA